MWLLCRGYFEFSAGCAGRNTSKIWIGHSIHTSDRYFSDPLSFLMYFLYTNLGLMIFNLIPLPPLDGEEILEFVLPAAWDEGWQRIKPYGPYILMGLFVLGPLIGFNLIGVIISPIITGMANLLL